MLAIRLKRAGGRNHPFYRVVVIDSRRARDSRAVEEIGYYNPLEDPVVVNIDREKVQAWTAKGAQLSDTVRTLLKRDNTAHPTRRAPSTFEPATPDDVKRRPARKEQEAAEVGASEGAVAVAAEAEAPATEPPAPETPEAAAEPVAEAKAAGEPEAAPAAEQTAAEEPAAGPEPAEAPEKDAKPEG